MQPHHSPSSTDNRRAPSTEGKSLSFPNSLVVPNRDTFSIDAAPLKGSILSPATPATITAEVRSEKAPWWRPLAESYFQIRALEANGAVYKALGVRLFKKALLGAVSRYVLKDREAQKDAPGYFIRGHAVEDLKRMVESTRRNEAIHLLGIVGGFIPALALGISPGSPLGICNLTFFFVNAYCVMLQRYNRGRLLKAITRAETDLSTRMQGPSPDRGSKFE